MAFPTRSAMISNPAICQLGAKASSGTALIWTIYPNIVIGQNSPVRSLSGPDTSRRP